MTGIARVDLRIADAQLFCCYSERTGSCIVHANDDAIFDRRAVKRHSDDENEFGLTKTDNVLYRTTNLLPLYLTACAVPPSNDVRQSVASANTVQEPECVS